MVQKRDGKRKNECKKKPAKIRFQTLAGFFFYIVWGNTGYP